MPYWEHVSPLPKTTSHRWCAGILSLKRNQKPLALAKHSHWSEGSLKLTCHQRKPHFLSSFLSFSSMKRSLMEMGIFTNGVRISPGPFQEAAFNTSSQNIEFHKIPGALNWKTKKLQRIPIIIFQRNIVFKCEKIVRFMITIHWKFTT